MIGTSSANTLNAIKASRPNPVRLYMDRSPLERVRDGERRLMAVCFISTRHGHAVDTELALKSQVGPSWLINTRVNKTESGLLGKVTPVLRTPTCSRTLLKSVRKDHLRKHGRRRVVGDIGFIVHRNDDEVPDWHACRQT